MGLRTKNNWLKMKDLWCIGAKSTDLKNAMTKPYKYGSEKNPLFLIYPWGK